jgi:LysM repeat protein
MSHTTPKFHHALTIFLGLAIAAFAADASDLAALRAKAEQGNGIAQYNLGLAYADAHQPYADRVEAFVWLSLAAERGSTGKELASLTDQMTPEQLTEGNRRLQQRRALLASAKDVPPPATTALGKLTAERDQLVASLNATTTELAALRAHQTETTGPSSGDTEKLRSDLARIENDLNEARAAARTLATKNQQLEDVASERGRALAAAQAELANAKNAPAPAAVSPQLSTLTDERDSLAQKLARSDRQVAMLGSQSMSALKTVEEQKQQLAELQAKVEKLAGENTGLAARLAAVPTPAPAAVSDASAEDAKAQLAEIEAKLTTALRSYSLLQQELDQTHEAVAKTETKLATTQAEAAALRTQVEALDPNGKEMVLLRQASISAATEAVELRDQLRQAQDSVARLAQENAQLKTRLALLGPPPAPMLAAPAHSTPPTPPATVAKSAPAQSPAPTSAAKSNAAAPAARQHVVAEGDTLSKISRRYYGTPDRWTEILEANRDVLHDARNLPVGASLRIP